MRKIIMILAFASVSLTIMAQDEVAEEKHLVSTNSFWANWYVQANFAATSFWGSQEDKGISFGQLTKDYRTNLGFSLAIGKWFTPGIGLRTKFNGVWGRSVISEDKATNANKYWTLQEQVMLNLSNMLLGYNEQRVWNFIPYLGGGIGRNMTYGRYSMGLGLGLLNTFRLTPKLDFNLDVNIMALEPDFDGCPVYHNASHTFKNKDRNVNVELGLTYRLGKSTWNRTPDIEAMQALSQSEIDALNAQLADALAENERLSAQEVDPQTPQMEAPAVQIVTAPVSVFFDLGKAVINSERELQNVAVLVEVAKQQGTKLLVTGYADSQTGSEEQNLQLSQQRADALVAELLKLGISSDQIEKVAAGGVDTISPAPFNRRATVEIK